MEKAINAQNKPAAPKRRGWGFVKLKKFRRSEDGAAALEFALVGIPFFLMIGAIFELTINYFVGAIMDQGVTQLARQLKTNQITSSTHTEAQFKQAACDLPIMAIFRCADIMVDVQQIAAFADPAIPRDNQGNVDPSNMGFNPGAAQSRTINILRVYYEWPVFMAFSNFTSDPLWSNGKRLLVSSEAFVIEP